MKDKSDKKTQKSFKNPSKSQIVYRNRKFAEELEKNSARGKFRGCLQEKGRRCCLKVAEDLARKMGLNIPESQHRFAHPNVKIYEFFGWKYNGEFSMFSYEDEDGKNILASSLNDECCINGKNFPRGISHANIAKIIRNQYVHPASPKIIKF